jgi:hypothetical protein
MKAEAGGYLRKKARGERRHLPMSGPLSPYPLKAMLAR